MDIAHLQIKVQAGASRNEVSSFEDGRLNLRVKRPPYRSKANDAIIILVSKFIEIPRNCIFIAHGATSKLKILEIHNIYQADLRTRLISSPSISNSG
ncbi:MAG: DUF167 domain-containing protein [Chloroflexota bacterium]|nr:DUF167 domain-containing protein [Chloroflexota bacterium]